MRLPTALLIALAGTIGCDGGTGPVPGAGHYALVSVNGMPLPYMSTSSTGYNPAIRIGDLVLRDDGTYGFGMSWYTQGTYSVDGEHLRLDHFLGASSAPFDAVIGGDSVVIVMAGSPSYGVVGGYNPSQTLLLRRGATPAPAASEGTWSLATIDGRGAPLTTWDTVINGTHYVDHVLYDSITISDGTFFRRHQAEESLRDGAVMGASEYNTLGSYRGQGDSLSLTMYMPPFSSVYQTDRLALEQGALVRRTAQRSGTLVERYAPR